MNGSNGWQHMNVLNHTELYTLNGSDNWSYTVYFTIIFFKDCSLAHCKQTTNSSVSRRGMWGSEDKAQAVGGWNLNPGLSSFSPSCPLLRQWKDFPGCIYHTLDDRKLTFSIPWVDQELLEMSFLQPWEGAGQSERITEIVSEEPGGEVGGGGGRSPCISICKLARVKKTGKAAILSFVVIIVI